MKVKVKDEHFLWKVQGKNILKNPPQDMTTIFNREELARDIRTLMDEAGVLRLEVDLQKGRELKIDSERLKAFYVALVHLMDEYAIFYVSASIETTKELTFRAV